MYSVRPGDIIRPHNPELRAQGLWVIKEIEAPLGMFWCHRWGKPLELAMIPGHQVDFLVDRKD